MAASTAAGTCSLCRRRGRRWSVRAAFVAAAGVAVATAGASAAAGADGEGCSPTDSAAYTRRLPQLMAEARPNPSVMGFPVGENMPEGRWASTCSLTCILPGINATRSVFDTPFKIGADVCVAHVRDVDAAVGPGNATLRARSGLTQALWTMDSKRGQVASRRPDPIVSYEPHATQEGTQPHCAAGSRLVDGQPWWPRHPDLLRIAKDFVADTSREVVADEAMVFGALSMARNVLGGGLQRRVGEYDLVAASVRRLGICLDSECRSVAAVDTTRPSLPITGCRDDSAADGTDGGGNGSSESLPRCLTTNVPIITHLGPDGVERPVHMESLDLLALGRGMLGSPGWFERAPTPFHLGGWLSIRGPTLNMRLGSKEGPLSIQDGMEDTVWNLNGTVPGTYGPDSEATASDFLPASPTTTPFLAHIATLFCAGKLRSFLRSSAACDGVRPWGRVHRASPSGEVHGNIMDAGVWAGTGKVAWTVTPTRMTPTELGNATPSSPNRPYLRPPWTWQEAPPDTAEALTSFIDLRVQVTPPELIGRSFREVNPLSVTEEKLASSLFQRQLTLPAAVIAKHTSSGLSSVDVAAAVSKYSVASAEFTHELDRLSHAYDRRVFQKEHPAPPVSAADLVMAIAVVVPELGALLILLLTTNRWGRTAWLGFSTIVIIGAVSLSGVIALASQEAAGAAWRARSTRTATHAVFPWGNPVNEWGDRTLSGTLVVVERSFLLLAPTAYRPAWVRAVAFSVCGVYVVTAATMAAWVLFVARRQRRARQVGAEAPRRGSARNRRRKLRRCLSTPAFRCCRGGHQSSGSQDDSGDDIAGPVPAARYSDEAARVTPVGPVYLGASLSPWPVPSWGVRCPPLRDSDGGGSWV